MRARVIKLSAAAAPSRDDVPCLAYPFEGYPPVLVDIDAFTAGHIERGDTLPAATLVLGMTFGPVASATGGGGDWRIGADGAARGFPRFSCGGSSPLNSPQLAAALSPARLFELDVWEPKWPVLDCSMLRVRWAVFPPPIPGHACAWLPTGTLITHLKGRTVGALLKPIDKDGRPLSLDEVRQQVYAALLGSGDEVLGAKLFTLRQATAAALPFAPLGQEVLQNLQPDPLSRIDMPTGARWV